MCLSKILTLICVDFNFADVSIFAKNQLFSHQNSTFTQTIVLKKFCRLFLWNPAFRLLEIALKLEKWKWCHNFVIWRYRQFFFMLFFFSCQIYVPNFHHWFRSYNNCFLQGTNQKSRVGYTPVRVFLQYLETWASKDYQIWPEHL